MRRRDCTVLLIVGATLWPLQIHAQQSRKIPRIGVLLPGEPVSSSPRTNAFLDGLRQLGYVEGRTIAIEWKWGQDQPDTLSGLAADLVRSNVDVIVTGGTPAARTLKATTRTIPIVMGVVGDPVAAGLVDNLAHYRFQHSRSGIRDKASRVAETDCVQSVVDCSAIESEEPATENRNEGDANSSSGNGPTTSSSRSIN